MKISVIIPCYNEENTIIQLLEKVKIQKKNFNLEIIISDDGSKDQTTKLLEKNKDFVNNFYNRLSRSLSIIINTVDPDVIVFGGGVSNEIKDLNLIKQMTGNWSGNMSLKTNFLKYN